MNDVLIDKLLDVGIALSREKNPDLLFQIILDAAMDIIDCDGGTLYTVEDDHLNFRVMITHSQNIRKGGENGKIELPPVEMKVGNVCARAAIDRKIFRIDDVYQNDVFDFSGPRKYDALTGYNTRSMLVIPMEDDQENVIGVLQFINALNKDGQIVPFAKEHENIVRSMASQAAICLTNHNYSVQLRQTLDSIVAVMSTAIDALTPYNANHTKNMSKYGKAFLDWMEESGKGFEMDDEKKRRFLMSVQLHDVGKLVTPLEVMNKETRLGAVLEQEVMQRFRTIALIEKVAMLEGRLTNEDYEEKAQKIADAKEFVARINKAGFLPDEDFEKLSEISKYTYITEEGEEMPWLTKEEVNKLEIKRGTLTQDERVTMENHVVMTARLLNEMKFPQKDKEIPLWAADHHEFLDGSGYPNHKHSEDICPQVRLLTILDIFDALTARDRPYKKPMPVEKALDILDSMAYKEGKLDPEILELFKESRAWGDL